MIRKWFDQGYVKSPAPLFWREYLEARGASPRKDMPLSELEFVVFDTETTGLNPKNDQILSIGAVKLRRWEIVARERFECFLHQVYQPLPVNVALHGILPVHRERSLEEPAAIRAFLTYIGPSVLVGHHVGFDARMINAALREMGLGALYNHTVDTAGLARRLSPPIHPTRPEAYSLDALADAYRLPLDDRHTAAGDAFLTALLFMKLMARLEKRGAKTLRDLLRKGGIGPLA
jgi:DNA polymerase-3 subunit epsilon